MNQALLAPLMKNRVPSQYPIQQDQSDPARIMLHHPSHMVHKAYPPRPHLKKKIAAKEGKRPGPPAPGSAAGWEEARPLPPPQAPEEEGGAAADINMGRSKCAHGP